MTPIRYMDNKKVHNFVTEALKAGYGLRGIEFYRIEGILDILINNRKDINLGLSLAQKAFVDNVLIDMYSKYKFIERPKFIIDQFQPYFKYYDYIQKFVDIGCGQNTVCEYLLNQKFNYFRGIGTDVIDYRKENVIQNIEFRKQLTTTEIPLEDDEANYLLLANVLHHINQDELYDFLKEIFRILASDGVLLVLEDSWDDDTLPMWEGSDLYYKFKSLDNSEKIEAMKIIDWIGTSLLVKNNLEFSRPYSFKNIEKWIDIFSALGFKMLDSRFLGFPPQKLHLNPQTRFVLTIS